MQANLSSVVEQHAIQIYIFLLMLENYVKKSEIEHQTWQLKSVRTITSFICIQILGQYFLRSYTEMQHLLRLCILNSEIRK